jgi:hypothetical protein
MRNRVWGVLFVVLVLAGVALDAVPLYVIRPFRAQGPQELFVALTFLRWAPVLTIVFAVAALLAAIALWNGEGVRRIRLRRAGLVLGVLLVSAAAVGARVNIFERMFAPVPEAQYLPVALAKIEADDMVLAVRKGDQARAYPIREMAYHHLVNDVLAGSPIVVTY